MIEVVVSDLEQADGHWFAVIQARQQGVLIFLDRIALDRKKDRRIFASEVASIAPEASTGDIERQLLQHLDTVMSVSRGGSEGDDLRALLGTQGSKKESQATRLLELCNDLDLFHSPDGEAFATVIVDDVRQTWPLSTGAFKALLSKRFHEQYGAVPSSQALADGLNALRGRALFDGPEYQVHVRIAELGGAIYIDLANQSWQAIEVTRSGWRIIEDPPVKFRRPKEMLPLPIPTRGGRLDDLRHFVNLPADESNATRDDDWHLLLTWLVMALRPTGPYAVLLFRGPQGSAKSTVMRILRMLVDPNAAPLRRKPRDETDLLIAATNGWMIALDNLSHLADELSDGICALATGTGIGKRQLYTDGEETLLAAMRPIALNGIGDVVERGDLVDRGMLISLPPIPKQKRMPEKRLWREFEIARPGILGALLDALVVALAGEDEIELTESLRMADVCHWGAAAAPALGWSVDAFLKAYERNQYESHVAPLEGSPLTRPILAFAKERAPWQGTMSELLDDLRLQVDDRVLRDRSWPKDATRLSTALSRLAPSFLSLGLSVTVLKRTAASRGVAIEWIGNPPDGDDDRTSDAPSSDESRLEPSSASSASSDGPNLESDTIENRDGVPSVSVMSALVGNDGADADDAPFRLSSDETVVVIRDSGQLCAIIPQLAVARHLGFDLETTGLDPRSHRPRLAQFAVPGGQTVVVDLFEVDARLLAPIFEDGPHLIGHNLKFDLQFLTTADLPVPDGSRLFDTMLGVALLGAGSTDGRPDRCSLEAVVERELGVVLDKSGQKSDWSGRLSEGQIAYAARDASILLPLASRLRSRINGAGLDRVMALEMRALPAVAWLEHAGAPFDPDAWRSLSDTAVLTVLEVEDQLRQTIGGVSGADPADVNWSSPKQVLDMLRLRGHAVDRTDEATLWRLAQVEPLASLILRYREARRRESAYGIEFLRHLSDVTGRLHPTYWQLGAASGRMSCSRPNLQQVPHDPAYRACFRPGEGRVLVKADYSQLELRIAAELTNDQRMLAAYDRGEDLHVVTAAAVLGRSNGQVRPDDRQAAKALNFGLLYGMGAATLKEHAARNYGVSLTEAESARLRGRFFEAYPELRRWHRAQPGGAVDTRTLAGRRRLAVAGFTEKLNTPIQGTGADGLKAALGLLWETRDCSPSAAPVLCVHDEIVLQCNADEAERTRDWLEDCMRRGMQAFLHRVPVVVDTAILHDWSGE